MANNTKKIILAILDGWGVAGPIPGNAIYEAKTPTLDMIEKSYLATTLQASGIGVGLPWGREGNSEVGHLNLGAGRIVYQYLPRIVTAIRDGSFFQNKALMGAVNFAKRNNSTLHFIGLLSSGSVHSYIDHVYALLDLAQQNELNPIIHMFTDGKDSFHYEAKMFVQNLEERFERQGVGKIGTVIGRAYAMDRNNRWDLTQVAYELITEGKGNPITDIVSYLDNSYKKGRTDVDIEPAVVVEGDAPVGLIKQGDSVIFFNFREDSARQLTKAFVLADEEFNHFPRKKISNLYFVTLTRYQDNLPVEVAFPPPDITNTLSETISNAGKKQLHIAETEKYAHVTYFFNGEREEPFPGEERLLVPSVGTPHYDRNPDMQAYNITEKLVENLQQDYAFYLINIANADMIGHTGNIKAAIQGIEAVDGNLSILFEAANSIGASLIITADHGNAEEMLHPKTGRVQSRHSINPVPFYLVDERFKTTNVVPLYEQTPRGVLADVAPTILKLMQIPIPNEMTGTPLI